MVFNTNGKKAASAAISPYWQERFQLIEKHCIHPFYIRLGIYHVTSIRQLHKDKKSLDESFIFWKNKILKRT